VSLVGGVLPGNVAAYNSEVYAIDYHVTVLTGLSDKADDRFGTPILSNKPDWNGTYGAIALVLSFGDKDLLVVAIEVGAMTRMAFLGTPWSCARFPPESGHSSAAPLRPNKGVIHGLASDYDSNQ
jgi:hypothetical protein